MAEQEVQIFRRLGKIVQTKLSVGYEAEQKGLEKTIQELSKQIDITKQLNLLSCSGVMAEEAKSRREIPPT